MTIASRGAADAARQLADALARAGLDCCSSAARIGSTWSGS